MRLKDKVIVVTGAGSGIGAGIAKRFAEEGAQVVVADIDPDSGSRVASQLVSAGGKAKSMSVDVTNNSSVASLFAWVVSEYGHLHGVINNAGWSHHNKPLLDVSEAEFDKTYAVNVKSIYLTTHHAVPIFRKQSKGGFFVNIASTAGIRPRPGLTWYNGSKGAVITTSRSIAVELGHEQIRVNCINPVFNPDTALSSAFAGGAITEDVRKRFLSTIPMGRFSTALDVANAALYLASDEAGFITGVCIEVDGGRCV